MLHIGNNGSGNKINIHILRFAVEGDNRVLMLLINIRCLTQQATLSAAAPSVDMQ